MSYSFREMHIQVVGQVSGKETLFFEPGKWECGKITDGVSMRFKGEAGGWILAYKDLVRMVDAATKARERG